MTLRILLYIHVCVYIDVYKYKWYFKLSHNFSRSRETDIVICWITLKMPTVARIALGESWEPGTQSGSPMWMTGSWVPEYSPAASHVMPESRGFEPRHFSVRYDVLCLQCQMPTPLIFFYLLSILSFLPVLFLASFVFFFNIFERNIYRFWVWCNFPFAFLKISS